MSLQGMDDRQGLELAARLEQDGQRIADTLAENAAYLRAQAQRQEQASR